MGTTAQKLQRVLDTKEGLKDTINTYLGQDITSAIPFKDYETYIKNFYGVLPKTSYAEGSNITLSNCLKGKLDEYYIFHNSTPYSSIKSFTFVASIISLCFFIFNTNPLEVGVSLRSSYCLLLNISTNVSFKIIK